jgi:Fur family transcriptional regulator, peroxide stress response regulator
MVNEKLSKQHLEQLKQLCNEAGIKLTHQRLEIFKELMSDSDHPSAERIHKRLHEKLPTIAIDTVYRTLATFDELGLVKKLHIMNERTLFDTNLNIHHHFICTRCKKVEDIYWPDFDNTMLPEGVKGIGRAQSRHLEIHGVCNSCLDKTEE